jgi:RNA polymerase sigma factor (sigma-70 family)
LQSKNRLEEVIAVCALESELRPPVSAAPEDTRFLRDAAYAAYHLLMATRPDQPHVAESELWIERVVTVLAANLASGRYACACRYEHDASLPLSRYAQRVLGRLMAEWERVEELRSGDSLRWAPILSNMERLAYFWLGPAGRQDWARWEAREAASKTCFDLWDWLQRNPFPFDVPFDRWAERALRNRLKHSVRSRRKQARHEVDSLDHPGFEECHPYAALLPNDDMRLWLERETRREAVQRAWMRLDQRQAYIIHRWYVEGWSADEIAAETKLEINHIYVLKHRALRKLREYCDDES